jgi:predicted P-loop ATPase
MTKTKERITAKQIMGTLAHYGYKFRLNVLTDEVEANGVPLNDIELAVIHTVLRDRGYRSMPQVDDAIVTEASKHPFHPIKNYLHSLLGWDGQPHIEHLAGFFTDIDGLFPILLTKWMIGSVAKVFTHGQAQNPMLVLDGRQNLGKSNFCLWLNAPHLREKFFYEGPINPDQKDDKIKLINIWHWEVTELGSTVRRADREALKAFISLRQVTVRKPYGKKPIVKPALSSFIGTLNNEGGFLTDPTGHRRFRPVTLTKIDWAYAEKISQADIWAEAYARYLMGETYRLTPDEFQALAPIRERYQLIDPMEEMLQKYFEIDPSDDTRWLSTIEILHTLETSAWLKGGPSRQNTMALSVAATRLGLQKVKRNNQNGYLGVTHRAMVP